MVTLNGTPELTWEVPEVNIITKFKLWIINSVITVECDTSRYTDELLSLLYNRAVDIAKVALDMLAFTTGWGLTPIIDQVIKPNGPLEGLFLETPQLSCISTTYNIETGDSFAQMLGLVLSDPPLFMALNDLTLSNAVPHHAPVNCGRAMDSLCRIFTPVDEARDKGWPLLREALRIDRAYIDLILDNSKGPRHGDRTWIPGYVVNEIVKRSWIVMNRFLEYKKRGSVALPESEFKTLFHGDVFPPS